MREFCIKIAYKGFAYAMIGVVLLLIANKTLYTHSHVLDDGTVITHAHPYDKGSDNNPFPSHQHSNTEILLFSILSFLPLIMLSFAFTLMLRKTAYVGDFEAYFYHSICPRFILGRAPPSFC